MILVTTVGTNEIIRGKMRTLWGVICKGSNSGKSPQLITEDNELFYSECSGISGIKSITYYEELKAERALLQCYGLISENRFRVVD
jgi:hypothetical protein